MRNLHKLIGFCVVNVPFHGREPSKSARNRRICGCTRIINSIAIKSSCTYLVALLVVCHAGCKLHQRPARRADFISRIIPPPACATADNMMLAPSVGKGDLPVVPDVPEPVMPLPPVDQPDTPRLDPPTPGDPAPNNPPLSRSDQSQGYVLPGSVMPVSLSEDILLGGVIDVRENSNTVTNGFSRGGRAPGGRPGITTYAEISNAQQLPVQQPTAEIVPPGPLAEELVGNNQDGIGGWPMSMHGNSGDLNPCRLLSLGEAVAVALRQNPQLGIARAEIDKAAGGKKIAFSAFLPSLGVVDTLSCEDISVGNTPTPVFAPLLPLEWNSEYNLVELETQWIIWDFGRRVGKYRQADIMEQIACLKYQRACQTVAYDATEAYYRVLLAYSTVVTGENTLRRAEEFRRVANNLFEQGEVDRESVYTAELQVAKAKQMCVSARARVNTSTARLNMTMGVNTVCPLRVQPIEGEPEFAANLYNCLHTAVSCRREIQVVSDWVAKACEATNVAKADFMPKIVSSASYASTGGNFEADAKYGFISFAWDIYAGGRRSGKLLEERADTQRAIAGGRQVCDRIGYEVNYAYQKVEDAAERIDLARSAVRLAEERLRIVMNKFQEGEDSPTDVIDAQTSMSVAEQRYYDTIFQLRSAIARLEYAMGVN